MGMHLTGVYLKGVYLTGVHLMGMYLINVHLTDVHLINVHLTDVHLIDVYFMDEYIPDPPPYKRGAVVDLSRSEWQKAQVSVWPAVHSAPALVFGVLKTTTLRITVDFTKKVTERYFCES
jgi:hypothetical protein